MARRVDSEEYAAATLVARDVRGVVAEQVSELVRDGDRMGSREELQGRIERVNFCQRRIREALGRQQQAAELGMPLAPSVRDEGEFRDLLREAAMSLAVSAATWVAAMDYEHARVVQASGEASDGDGGEADDGD